MENLKQKILALKKEKNAVILAHYYQQPEIQEIADYVGDSYGLSIEASRAPQENIHMCGVRFMAETAKILSPQSIVLHPEPGAGCPMSDMAPAHAVREYREAYPDTVLVAYVNTTAAVKAEVDICCTSANAEKIIRSIPADKKIMFLPDQNLGANVMRLTGRKMELWPGYCPTHNRIMPEAAKKIRAAHPDAVMIVHPECLPAVVDIADYALSTGGMLRFAKETEARKIIIGTEHGILHRLRNENPGKEFIPMYPLPACPNMKKIKLESVLDALEKMQYPVELGVELMDRARLPIERMLSI